MPSRGLPGTSGARQARHPSLFELSLMTNRLSRGTRSLTAPLSPYCMPLQAANRAATPVPTTLMSCRRGAIPRTPTERWQVDFAQLLEEVRMRSPQVAVERLEARGACRVHVWPARPPTRLAAALWLGQRGEGLLQGALDPIQLGFTHGRAQAAEAVIIDHDAGIEERHKEAV